jgi:hypothetical protein
MAEPATILLVEDREDDVLVIRRAFEWAQIDAGLKIARDGKEGIAYLAGEGTFSNRTEYPLPWRIELAEAVATAEQLKEIEIILAYQ